MIFWAIQEQDAIILAIYTNQRTQLQFAGFSFLIMIIHAYINGTDSLVSPIWLVFSCFLIELVKFVLLPRGYQ